MSAAVAAWRERGSRSAVVLVSLVIVVAGLAAASGLLLARMLAGQQAQDAQTASVAAAKREVPALLSYSYQTFGGDLAHAAADTTGAFRGTYQKLMSGQVEQAAVAGHVVTQAAGSGASVIDAGPGTATLLLFLSEETKSDAKAEPVLNDTAVRVTMQDVNGTWLVAGLTPRS